MTREEAIEILKDLWRTKHSTYLEADIRKALEMAIKALEYDDAKYHEEHGEVVVDKAVWEDAKKALDDYAVGVDCTGRFVKASEVFCDRNICLRNEYNGIGCNECEVTKSQESNTVIGTGDGAYYRIKALQAQADGKYIPKQAVLENIDQWYEDKADIEDLIVKITYMPSVAIPPEHDGCKDCKYETYPEY